jgi:hypothetical protein
MAYDAMADFVLTKLASNESLLHKPSCSDFGETLRY